MIENINNIIIPIEEYRRIRRYNIESNSLLKTDFILAKQSSISGFIELYFLKDSNDLLIKEFTDDIYGRIEAFQLGYGRSQVIQKELYAIREELSIIRSKWWFKLFYIGNKK